MGEHVDFIQYSLHPLEYCKLRFDGIVERGRQCQGLSGSQSDIWISSITKKTCAKCLEDLLFISQ